MMEHQCDQVIHGKHLETPFTVRCDLPLGHQGDHHGKFAEKSYIEWSMIGKERRWDLYTDDGVFQLGYGISEDAFSIEQRREELHKVLKEAHAKSDEYVKARMPDPDIRSRLYEMNAEHFGMLGKVVDADILSVADELRKKFDDQDKSSFVELCGDVWRQQTFEGIITWKCDRPRHHAGNHARGEGMDAVEWPSVASDIPVPPPPPPKMPVRISAAPENGQVLNAGQAAIGDTGATSSHAIETRYEMISREFLRVVGNRYTAGLKHRRFNWRKGGRDPKFILDRISHMHDHFNQMFQPMPGDEDGFLDNIGAVAWGLSFLCEVYADEEGRKIIDGLMRPAIGN